VTPSTHRPFVAHGLILALLGLMTGLIGPNLALPRLGLAAHTVALLGAALLFGLAACWPVFRLSERTRRSMAALWLVALYTNWAGCLLGAAAGAGRLTPLAARGAEGPAWAELAVAGLLGSGSLAAFAAVALGLKGLRR
jgi:hydroxylaminobenzene mutase